MMFWRRELRAYEFAIAGTMDCILDRPIEDLFPDFDFGVEGTSLPATGADELPPIVYARVIMLLRHHEAAISASLADAIRPLLAPDVRLVTRISYRPGSIEFAVVVSLITSTGVHLSVKSLIKLLGPILGDIVRGVSQAVLPEGIVLKLINVALPKAMNRPEGDIIGYYIKHWTLLWVGLILLGGVLGVVGPEAMTGIVAKITEYIPLKLPH